MEQEPSRKRKRRRVRWPTRLLVGLIVLGIASVVVFVWAYRYRNDEFLARFINRAANKSLRGRLELGRVHWGLRAAVDLAMGTPTPVTIDHFAVYDPKGKEVIFAPRASGKVELWPLIAGGNLIVRGVTVGRGRCLVEQQRFGGKEPEIGLVAAFAPLKPNPGRGPQVALLEVEVGSADLLLKFPEWSLRLDRIRTSGSFRLTGGHADVEGVRYQLAPRAPSGLLVIRGVEVPLRNFRAAHFDAWPPRPLDIFTRFTVEAGGSAVKAEGWLLAAYGHEPKVDLRFEVESAQTLAARLLGPAAAGPGRLTATARGPLVSPFFDGRVERVSVGVGELRGTEISARVVLDPSKPRIGATELKGRLLGGQVGGAAGLNLVTGTWSLRADLTDVSTAALHPILAGKLSGRLRLAGTSRPLVGARVEVAGELRRTRRDWIPQRLKLGGTAYLSPAIVDLAGFSIDGEGQRATARGSINLLSRQVNMYLGLDAGRLGSWLLRRGLPDAVRNARASLQVRGRWPDLRATGPAEASGVGYGGIRLPRLRAELELSKGTLHLRKLSSDAYGGRLAGEAAVQIFQGGLDRPLPKPQLYARLTSSGLDLTALGAGAWAIGRVFGEAEIAGPLDALKGTARLRLPSLSILGDGYDGTSLRLALLRDRITVEQAELPRRAGGKLELWGDWYFNRNLDLRARLTAMPIVAIPGIAGLPIGLGGKLSGTVHATGTPDDPRFQGKVALQAAKVRGVDLGSGELELTPGSDGMRVTGQLLGRSFRVEGYLLTQPQPRLHLTIDVTRFPLEKLLYEMGTLGDVRASVDGRVRLAADAVSGLTWASLQLTRGELALLYRAPGERRQRRIELTTAAGISAAYDGKELRIDPARLISRLEGQTGTRAEFTVGGRISPNGPDLRLQGRVALALAEFFLAQQLKNARGQASTDVRLSGRWASPNLEGRIDLQQVAFRLNRFDREIQIHRGLLRLTPGRISLDRLDFELERARLKASGSLELRELRPDQANLRLSGDLSLRLLQIIFPEQFSHALGTAGIELQVEGPVRDPRLAGSLKVKRIELAPRGWGRTITLNRGEVAFSNYLVKTVRPLEGTYDEGSIRVSGEVRLDAWEPVDIYLKIAGIGIPQRQPKVYTAEANLNLILLGDSSQLTLKGDVDLVDARYVQAFDVVRQAFIRPRVFEEETPFWKGSPLLTNLQLRLNVQSTGQLSVKNDYANLSLSGALSVAGTLSEPRLGGQVRVEDGTFRIPFLRGEYSISRGEVSFNERKPIQAAEINITGETLLNIDRSGVDYQIRLTLQGPLDSIGIQLSSTPALDQGQILALLAFGRTTDQLRKQLKGSTEGGGQAAGAADAQVKQLTGEILSQIIEEPLKKVTRLDLIRFEVGTESAQIRACKKLGRHANLCGDYQFGVLGDSRGEGRVEVRITDLLMLVGKLERISTRLDVETIDPQRGRGELKLRIPLR